MGKESVRYINKIKLLHRFHLCSGKVVRYGLFTNGPGHDVHIVLFQQSLEPVQLAAQPLLSIAIEKTADHHVRLSRATMPGTELQAAKANVIDRKSRRLNSSH